MKIGCYIFLPPFEKYSGFVLLLREGVGSERVQKKHIKLCWSRCRCHFQRWGATTGASTTADAGPDFSGGAEAGAGSFADTGAYAGAGTYACLGASTGEGAGTCGGSGAGAPVFRIKCTSK